MCRCRAGQVYQLSAVSIFRTDSTSRCKQQVTPNHWHPSAELHGPTHQKTQSWPILSWELNTLRWRHMRLGAERRTLFQLLRHGAKCRTVSIIMHGAYCCTAPQSDEQNLDWWEITAKCLRFNTGADIAINYSIHLHKERKLKAVIRSKIALGQLCATNGTATDAHATATSKNHFKKDSGKTKMKMVGWRLCRHKDGVRKSCAMNGVEGIPFGSQDFTSPYTWWWWCNPSRALFSVKWELQVQILFITNLKQSNALSDTGEHCTEKHFHVSSGFYSGCYFPASHRWGPDFENRSSLCWICGGQSGEGTPPPPITSVFPSVPFHPILHIVRQHVALTMRTNGRSLATCK